MKSSSETLRASLLYSDNDSWLADVTKQMLSPCYLMHRAGPSASQKVQNEAQFKRQTCDPTKDDAMDVLSGTYGRAEKYRQHFGAGTWIKVHAWKI